MNLPPNNIDGAKVLKWAWSGSKPFGVVANGDSLEKQEIYGLAICQYEGEKNVYRFSCDKDWETIQDAPHDTVKDAIDNLPSQYKNVEAKWN
ncbi:MAG: hypothetical protein JWP69_1937 [Flaviaesturariibacter sp.]|nr:hypothetical protein [Flaviaesturariibacter sp.]